MYCCVKGQKIFYIYPPTNEYYLKKYKYLRCKWNKNKVNEWEINCIKDDKGNNEYIEWINYEINEDNFNNLVNNKLYPNINKCKGLKIVLNEGDMLYLPALYFHQVEQNCDLFGRCIAINYWYDMNYNVNYNLLQFMKNVLYNVENKKSIQIDKNEKNQDINYKDLLFKKLFNSYGLYFILSTILLLFLTHFRDYFSMS